MGNATMKTKRPLILEILAWIHSLFLFEAFYPFLASIFELKDEQFWRAAFSGLVLILPIILSHFLLQHIHHFLLYLAVGILLSSLTGFLSLCITGFHHPAGIIYGILSFIFSMAVFLIRIYTKISFGRMKKEFYALHGEKEVFPKQEWQLTNCLTRPRIYHWVWFTVLYLFGMLFHFTTFLYFMFTVVLFDIFIFFAFSYINSFHEYIHKNRRVANLPIQTMNRSHRMIGLLSGMLLVLFLLPAVFYGHEFEPELKAEKPTLTFMEVMQDTQQEMNTEISSEQTSLPAPPDNPEPVWLTVLMRTLSAFILACIVLAVISLLIRYVKKLGSDFSVESEDETVFLQTDHPDSAGTVQKHVSLKEQLSKDQQIRRQYRKTILKATKGQPKAWATPTELEHDADLSEHDISELHHAYEKARYDKE